MYIDVFNGDADGILSLVQIRKNCPVDKFNQLLITSVKRDISLVKNITDEQAESAIVTVLDVSFDKNYQAIQNIADKVKSIMYFDHHKADKLLNHNNLVANINTDKDVCTALLVSDYLDGKYHLWAIAAAYGDNLFKIADKEADKLNLSSYQKEQLKEFGILINYNGYGSSLDDLNFSPKELFLHLMNYDSPFDVINDESSYFYVLKKAYKSDNEKLSSLELDFVGKVCVAKLPNEKWARRVNGTLGNTLANEYKDYAIVVATMIDDENYVISLRAPKNNPHGAADICGSFVTGGGREAAAGINKLSISKFDDLVVRISEYYC